MYILLMELARKIHVFVRKIPAPAMLCVLVLAAFFPVLNNGFVNFDDVQYVLANPALRGSWLDALAYSPGYYHPVVTLLYKAEFSLFGLHPLPYHVTSLALHLANCVSVFYLFSLLGWRKAPAFLGALLFGLHPAHVEPVAWISGRKELLWGLFSFWTLHCYLKYIDTGRNGFFIVSLFCFILAALSKPFALMLAFALPLADYCRRRGAGAVLLLEKIPYFLAGGSLFLLSWIPSGFLLDPGTGVYNPANPVNTGVKSLLFYVWKLALPVNLSAMYPPSALPSAPAGWLFIAISAASAVYGARRLVRGPESGDLTRTAVFCLGFFLLTISPALLIPAPADRYAYVPAAGLIFLYSSLIWRLYEAFRRNHAPGRAGNSEAARSQGFFQAGPALAVFMAAHCAVLGAASYKMTAIWRDTFSLSGSVLKKYPGQGAAYCARADAYRGAGLYREAIADFDRCIEMRPDDWKELSNRARTYLDMGEFDKALADCGAAILRNPASARLFLHRGNVYFMKGDYSAALKDYDRALGISPGFAAASENKRIVLEKLKQAAPRS